MADHVAGRPVRVRVIQPDPAGTPVMGATFGVAHDLRGPAAFASGTIEARLYDAGGGTLKLANAAGADGAANLNRFRCLTDPAYSPGDEWIEVWEDTDLIGVWTPTGGSVDRGTITLQGEDATTLLKRTRETTVGYWAHSPRDVIEHYGRAWRALLADGFDQGGFTYSTSPQTTADGRWTYTRCQTDPANYPGVVRLDNSAITSPLPRLASTQTFPVGTGATDRYAPWRFECEFVPNTSGTAQFFVGLLNTVTPFASLAEFAFLYGQVVFGSSNDPSSSYAGLPFSLSAQVPVRCAVECRDRWLYYILNGRVVGCFATTAIPDEAFVRVTGPLNGGTVDVRSVTFRRADRLLVNNRAGDYRLPGNPTPGGLWGEYFDANDLVATYGATMASTVMLNPTREPVASRLEAGVNYPSANPPAWRPNGVPQDYFAARYTGSVYLDLDSTDVAVRVTCDDEATVWVGRTRGGEHAAYATGAPGVGASSWLKAGSSSASAPSGATGPLAGMRSGWYPIVVEYKQITGSAGIILEWESSAAVGTWTVIPPAKLSPYGVHRALVRNESHLDALKTVADTYGYQWTTDPRSLGSGEFPGRITPQARVGRDTERRLGESEATDLSRQVSLDQRADALQADAAGIADPDGAAQLTAEALNLPALLAHMTIGQDYESLADISEQALLEQRLNTLLALRASPWEEVGARPPGGREYLDAWPLTGALAEFAWGPGDGIRLDLPSIGVVDTAPRQILGLAREFTPTGLRPPTASFRPRPRSLVAALRDLRRTALGPQRNYQQQLAVTTGSLGSSITAAAPDAYSRLYIPNLDQLANGRLEVVNKSDQSAWDLEVNGTVRLSVTRPGSYDITAWLTPGYNYARLVASGGSTGSFTVRLNLTVRV